VMGVLNHIVALRRRIREGLENLRIGHDGKSSE
jgi:hypothetical protein